MTSAYRKLKEHVEDPLFRNAYFLMFSSLTAAGSGFFFWLISARLYPPESVGVASAIVAAMGLISMVASLGFDVTLVRFLPERYDKEELINTCMTVSFILSLSLSILFVMSVDVISPSLSLLKNNEILLVLFIVYTSIAPLMALQREGIFAGLRRAEYSFVQTLVTFARLGIVPLLTSFGAVGIYAAFGLTPLLAFVVGSALISRVIPYKPSPLISGKLLRELFHFSAGNYVAKFLENAPTFILPIIVVNHLGAEATAHFYIAWQISMLITAIPRFTSVSLIAEGSYNRSELGKTARKALKLTYSLLTLAVVGTLLFGRYILSIFGTFITRTGLISSVHAFAKSGLGVPFFVFLGISILGSLTLLFKRLDTLKTEHELESFLSREAVFLLQNMLFVAITVAVFWGTVFPMISELVTGERITVGPPYFEKVTGPMFAALVLLMGVAPFFAWRKQTAKRLPQAMWFPFVPSAALALSPPLSMRMHPAAAFGIWLVAFVTLATLLEYWKGIQARRRVRGENVFTAMARLIARNRRRYGGYIVHLGVFMMALGVIGDAYFQKETQAPLTVGQTLGIDEYTIRFEGLRAYNGSDGREIVEATVSLFRDGEFVRTLKPRRDFFVVQQQPVTIPAVYSTPVADVYVLLVGWEEISFSSSTFKMYLNPLIVWLWTGGIVLIIGTMIAMWPAAAAERETSYVLRPGVLQPQASAGG